METCKWVKFHSGCSNGLFINILSYNKIVVNLSTLFELSGLVAQTVGRWSGKPKMLEQIFKYIDLQFKQLQIITFITIKSTCQKYVIGTERILGKLFKRRWDSLQVPFLLGGWLSSWLCWLLTLNNSKELHLYHSQVIHPGDASSFLASFTLYLPLYYYLQ